MTGAFLAMLVASQLVSSVADDPPGLQRYALVIGANRGGITDVPLQYADKDAQSVAKVLTTIGNFAPNHVMQLTDPDANSVRTAFRALHAQLTEEASLGHNTVFFVYYSGHADSLAMHLDSTQLAWRELLKLTETSGATTRLVVVDSCRSGALTRLKGGRPVRAFDLPDEEDRNDLPQGLAILASASARESAQESDEIGGSYFTHHLLAALRGAADTNADGRVTLNEAFQYSADRTAFATAETMGGVQHATYRYRLHGRNDLVLTSPAYANTLAAVSLRTEGTYRFLKNNPNGPLALEVIINNGERAVSLPPGKYYIQQRTATSVREGTIDLVARQDNVLDDAGLAMVKAAAVASKGAPEVTLKPSAQDGDATASPWSAGLWGGVGRALLPGFSAPWTAGFELSRQQGPVIFDFAVDTAQSVGQNSVLKTSLGQYGGVAGARLAWGWRSLQFSAGLRGGVWYVQEGYTGAGPGAPSERYSVLPRIDGVLGARWMFGSGFFLGADALASASRLSTAAPISGNATQPGWGVQPLFALGVGVTW